MESTQVTTDFYLAETNILVQKILTFSKKYKFPNIFDSILLECIEYCGFGSWKNISNMLIKKFSNIITKHHLPISIYNIEELKIYYLLLFSPQFNKFLQEYQISDKRPEKVSTRSENRQNLPISRDFIAQNLTNDPLIDATSINFSPCLKNLAIKLNVQEEINYRPFRGDFDVEFKDDDENKIIDLLDEHKNGFLRLEEDLDNCKKSGCKRSIDKNNEYDDVPMKKMRLCLISSYSKVDLVERFRKKFILQKLDNFINYEFNLKQSESKIEDSKLSAQYISNTFPLNKLDKKLISCLQLNYENETQFLYHNVQNDQRLVDKKLVDSSTKSEILQLGWNLLEMERIKNRIKLLESEQNGIEDEFESQKDDYPHLSKQESAILQKIP